VPRGGSYFLGVAAREGACRLEGGSTLSRASQRSNIFVRLVSHWPISPLSAKRWFLYPNATSASRRQLEVLSLFLVFQFSYHFLNSV